MCSYWVGLGFYYTTGDIQWRFPIAFQSIFTIIMYVHLALFNPADGKAWLHVDLAIARISSMARWSR